MSAVPPPVEPRVQTDAEIMLRRALDEMSKVLALAHGENRVLRDQIKARARNLPYPFCHRPEHCAGKGYCDSDPACNE